MKQGILLSGLLALTGVADGMERPNIILKTEMKMKETGFGVNVG